MINLWCVNQTKVSGPLESKVFDVVRIPCIVLVVMVHITGYGMRRVNLFPDDYSLYMFVNRLFSNVIGGVAVPVFFLVSGYLFFRNCEFNITAYRAKLKRRLHTLLIPFLLWNAIYVFVKLLPLFIPAFARISFCEFPGVISYKSLLSAFWNFNDSGFPIVVPLWFLRDLIVMSILSPIVYCFIKYTRLLGLMALILVWVIGSMSTLLSWIPLNMNSVFFFTAGAYFGIKRVNIVEAFWSVRHISWCYILFVSIEMVKSFGRISPYIHRIGMLFGIVGVFALITKWVAHNPDINTKSVSGIVFFIYAVHDPWLVASCGRVVEFLLPTQQWSLVIGYFTTVFVIVSFGIVLYKILNKLVPKAVGVMVGRRV